MARTAVILFNLGGPDRIAAVAPFLVNLFSDPAIIALPQPLRGALARLIAWRRAATARAIYARLGGASPILANTEAQARALGNRLGDDYRCFVAMRYWHPFTDAAARAVAAWRPERVVLLPLYPQFSTTTTGSSLAAWHGAARRAGIAVPTSAICCFPQAGGFIAALAGLIRTALDELPPELPRRVLFSAHGLPEKIVRAGDPYRWQVEATVAALRDALGDPDLDCVTCYQSRVGPLAWIGPSTDAEIARAAASGRAVVVVPVAFVSEHSETLVELDIEYRHLAEATGAPAWRRVPTVGTEAAFIAALAGLVRGAEARGAGTAAAAGGRLCPAACGRCAMAAAA